MTHLRVYCGTALRAWRGCDHCGMQPSKGHSYMPVYGDELPQMCPLAQKGAGRG